MSKTSGSHLTGLGKAGPHRLPGLTIDLRDALDARLRNIGVVAGLLAACREEALPGGAVEQAGELIGDEVRATKTLLEHARNLP